MTNLERDQLLPTAPEVGFEVAMTLACSWNIVLHMYCFYLHAIGMSLADHKATQRRKPGRLNKLLACLW